MVIYIFLYLYLSNQKVHIFLDEHVQLLLEDGLHLCLTLTAQVGWSLGHSSCNQSVTLVGNLTGQITGGLVNLCSLQNKARGRIRQEIQKG